MKKNTTAIAALIAGLAFATGANATALTVDAGWSFFSFASAGSAWSDEFTFTLTDTAYFVVTDAFCAGDQFSFSVNGTYQGETSTPFYDGTCTGPTQEDDPDLAFSSSYWSSGEIELTAGSYTITGLTVLSPFGGGGAYAQLSSTSLGGTPITPSVPLPAGGLMLISAAAGLGLMRRRKKA